MVGATSCPDIPDLKRLVAGQVGPAEVETLGRHLLQCQTCVDTLRGIDAQDSLVENLKTQTGTQDKKLVDSLIHMLSQSRRMDTPAPDRTTAETATKAQKFDFLQPARGPDEIGWLGNYRVLRLLGSGGMGMVFLAEDTCLQRQVALKVLKTDKVEDVATSQQRFLREARLAASIKHDHIVTIYQVGQENEVPYLAMELLEGESLEARLDRTGMLPIKEALRIGRETCEALAAAHELGLVHRDIKPANIWLETRPGAEGRYRVKILDFGLARQAGKRSDLTSSGLIVGTPRYMAPEQARGQEVDFRTDLFSLGCVLYHMSSGDFPFQGDSAMSVLTALAVEDPPPLSSLAADLPPAYVELVQQLLAKKPASRPASAREVAETLQAIETGLGSRKKSSIVSTAKDPPPLLSMPPASMPTITGIFDRPDKGARAKRWLLAALVVLVALVATAFFASRFDAKDKQTSKEPVREQQLVDSPPPKQPGPAPTVARPIKVGVLHSMTGTFADGGNGLIDATLLAIEEINERGGVLGRPIEPLVRDGASDDQVYVRELEKLITTDKVCTVFGVWASSCRKAVKPVVEKHDHLLVYPVQYEGLEQSPNIVYNGAAPNQQIIPAVKYCYSFLEKRRFFLVGSDYVFPRTANAIIKDELKKLGGTVVGEEYVHLGSGDVQEIVQKIVAAKPDMILNTINGDSNGSFFRRLRAAGVRPADIPTVSFSIGENELRHLAIKDMIGDYAAWNYFQSIDRPQNAEFVRRFKKKYGPQRVVSDPMEAAYFGVHLWAQAVQAAGSDQPAAIRRAIRTQSFEAPEGTVRIDAATLHTWKTPRLGRIREGGQFEVIHTGTAVAPEPYPATRTRAEWDQFLDDLYRQWGNRWHNPGSSAGTP